MPSNSDRIRSSRLWRELSQEIRQECPFCQICESETRLEVHHIQPLSERPELAFKRSNFIVLCHKCHNEIEATREPLPLLGPPIEDAALKWEQNLKEFLS